MKTRITILFLFFCYVGLAQLRELEYELFDNQVRIVFKVDSSTVKCKKPYFDESVLFDTIKYIVNVDTVLHLLKKITFQQVTVSRDSLEELYQRYALRYDEIWGKFYLNFCLPRSAGEIASSQFKVLSGFETTLKSMSLIGKKPGEIWKNVLDDFEFSQNLIGHKKSRVELFDEALTYSEVYERLNSKTWYASFCGFTYLDPYVDKVKEFYIKELKDCDCPFEDNNCNIPFLRNNIRYLIQIRDERIPNILVKNKTCLTLDQQYLWFSVRYLERNHHPALLEVTLSVLFNSEPAGHIDYKLAYIFKNKSNLKIFQEALTQAILNGNRTAIKKASDFPFRKSIRSLKKIKRASKNNPELTELIEKEIRQIKYKRKIRRQSSNPDLILIHTKVNL